MEADLNGLNKIIYNRRVLPKLEANRAILYEVIGGRRGQSSQHAALNKNLACDISNQAKRPTVVKPEDATNFYDRMSHPIARMKYQHFGVQVEYLLVLFSTMQSIKIFLRTSFGVSTKFTGTKDKPFQGAIQGNGSDLTICLILSISLFRYLYDSKWVSA